MHFQGIRIEIVSSEGGNTAETDLPAVIDLLLAVEVDFDAPADNAATRVKSKPTVKCHKSSKRERERQSPGRQVEAVAECSAGRKGESSMSPNRFHIPLLTSAVGKQSERHSRSHLRSTPRTPVYMTSEEKEFEKYKSQKNSEEIDRDLAALVMKDCTELL